ncbi:thiamine pyrophosphate-dependent enzyme [Bythopirellula polymerisocia]|uniref:Pyruvate dehydrogenase [ubiquinone] n=1 Tax=Bythopirellula polymerisocia TaxID=2528003 RepID=A0A5C6CYM1_9BACT|nr:thiamine pyrophosphate-dependent enzyme [Bythopirellula polymerisocia]TWU29670.1 Pyruvate dehydrogenase [ubiquinone] [Bythopirellula polymerisocia]
MSQNVCENLLDILAGVGVRDIFGVTGDALNAFLEAIRTDKRFRWIGVRHEENAAYAAYAQAELTGGIGVCAGTVGPGALHLINGLYNAKKECAGVLAITGQVAHGERGSNYFQEVNLSKMFDDICSYQAVINSPTQMPRLAEIAVQKALLERTATRIELPIDVTTAEVKNQHFMHPLVSSRPSMLPPSAELDKAAKIINEGNRVALFCGVGCREAKDEVLALAEKLKAPIVHTLRAKDIFDYGDGNVVGLTGLIGNPAGYHAVWDCDVLVMLGTNFPYDGFIPDGIKIVQVDYKVENLGRRAPITLGLMGTVKETLEELAPRIKNGQSEKFLQHLGKMRDKWLKQMDEQADLSRTDEPLHPQLFAKAISDRASSDAIFCVDVGECTVWTARQVRLSGGRRMLGSFNHGSLGAGFPIAIGASALDPQRQVWALCGDGGFGMAMQDFVTAVRFNLPLKVIVFNNSELGFVKMEMEVSGLPLYPAATGLLNPNFAEYAKVCGGDGVRVEHAKDIVPAVEQAIASDKPFVIDAVVSPGELTMPPTITMEEAWGFGMSKAKEALLGLEGDHAQWEGWKEEFKANFPL